ncbi:MAG: hypothetical protein ALECFALPRED_007975 [Alectoria fallacina]|uniref:RTA1 like protein n=1 Tax=Alectoria fallacina TaxID=1903189 RepID=A0A8H3PF85_9LECA|nr:MAG: hypothetical protein ALECFALPRED_007975 [Alectoria fallacina]
MTFIYYHYTPTLAGAVLFILLFSVITLAHLFQLLRLRAWFMIPVLVGGIFEITAYLSRSISHFHTQSLGLFLLSSILALVAPALFAATTYMILGRLIRLLNAPHHSLINVDHLTKIFVTSDIVSFQVQSAGAGLQAGKAEKSQHTGQILVIAAALFLQITIFSLFVTVATIFHIRALRQPTQQSRSSLPWQKQMQGLGTGGYIDSHEVFLYVFDAVPMFAVMVVLLVIYAPKLFKRGKGRWAPAKSDGLADQYV